ncbi:FCD domain-containing protein [Ramlibacter sp. AW1]|uniref:FCD domain-containing protein n=1 Tax=Ramlibacter aurantiacus TaxID=2801330 RepID=A0A936ZLK5_9BURK|nr:FCD domain-containing protein [Ramlibacter aurantiacus]MBL0422428.1 FCD domain-containing protein [Ramlibacter aurantiacus]
MSPSLVTPEPNAIASPPRSLIEAAYQRMRRDIIAGHLSAGQKLRVEHLKSRYGVGAGTLREAMALLVADALVESESQRGFSVAPISLEDLADLTRIRVLLEGEALRESIAAGTDDWEAGVVSTFHKLTLAEQRLRADPAGAFEGWEFCNRQFHEALVAACRSRRLLRSREVLYQQAERYRRLSTLKAPPSDDLHEEHKTIFDAVMARDADRASALLATHINRALLVIRNGQLIE